MPHCPPVRVTNQPVPHLCLPIPFFTALQGAKESAKLMYDSVKEKAGMGGSGAKEDLKQGEGSWAAGRHCGGEMLWGMGRQFDWLLIRCDQLTMCSK
jgi:hypothetical protein